MIKYISLIILFVFTACEKKDFSNLEGYEFKILSKKDLIVTLDDKSSLIIYSNKDNINRIGISNMNGILSLVQIEKEGITPIGIDFLTSDKAKISIHRGRKKGRINDMNEFGTIIFDDNGDGIPEKKVDKSGRYVLESLKWKLDKSFKPNKSLEPTP